MNILETKIYLCILETKIYLCTGFFTQASDTHTHTHTHTHKYVLHVSLMCFRVFVCVNMQNSLWRKCHTVQRSVMVAVLCPDSVAQFMDYWESRALWGKVEALICAGMLYFWDLRSLSSLRYITLLSSIDYHIPSHICKFIGKYRNTENI